jgi:hypothetical protein
MRIARRALDELPAGTLERWSDGAFFVSPGFADLWRVVGGRPVAWTLEADGVLAAVLPGVEYGRGPLARFLSMPDGCYGGVVADPATDGERPRFAAALLEAVTRRRYARAWVFDYHRTLPERGPGRRSSLETSVVAIAADWAPSDRKLQSQVRKAAREGIVVERFQWARHGERFLALARATAARHATEPRYPPGFYGRLAALAERDPRVVWRWCERDGRAACAHVYFVERGVLQAWQTYFDKAFSFLKPNPFIRVDTCRRMATRGVHALNLGSTPAHATGLAYYKGRWGGTPVRYDAVASGVLGG